MDLVALAILHAFPLEDAMKMPMKPMKSMRHPSDESARHERMKGDAKEDRREKAAAKPGLPTGRSVLAPKGGK